MSLNLSDHHAAMLEGRCGHSLEVAMRMLVAVARAYGTRELIPCASAHVGMSVTSLGEAGVEMLEGCAKEGARFAIPTTTNVLSVDGRAIAQQADPLARLQVRARDAVLAMGAIPNYSCNPFSQGHGPAFGQSVAWSESATAPYINAVLGARTNREGATALASALTGLTPRYGLHLEENRRADLLFHVTAPLPDLHSYHLLAAAVCRRSGGRVPALSGLAGPVGADRLGGFCAAFATFCNGAMFHMIGITPEAPDLATLFPQGAPNPIEIGATELEEEGRRMRGCDPARAQLVVIGCPHATLAQLQRIADLAQGARVRADCRFLIHTNGDVLAAAQKAGLTGALLGAGIEVSIDTCIYVGLRQYAPGTQLVTDSAKMAFLMASRGLAATVADTGDCVAAATR